MFRIPKAGEIWRHEKKQKLYFITEVLNEGNDVGDDNNPPMIRYMDGDGGRYGREYLKWHESFTFVETL